MRPSLLLVLLAICLLVSASYVTAQDDDETAADAGTATEAQAEGQEGAEDEVQMTDLQFTHLFPDAPLGNIESGKNAHILIGISNNGDTEYTIRTMGGSFRFFADFNQVLQNFTTYTYGVTLKPGEQATLSYRWPIQPLFEPAEFGFTLLVTYEDSDGIEGMRPGFNGTITVVDPIRGFDLQMLFIFVFLGSLIAAGGYYVNKTFFTTKKTTRSASGVSSAPAAPETKEEKRKSKKNYDDEWLPDHLKKSGAK